MHLCLIVGSFVPHNLISVQESPFPLPKFLMDPRFKNLMSFGSKKETQIYFLFAQKSPGKLISSRFPNGAPMDRDISLQGIFCTYLLILKPQCPLGQRKEFRYTFLFSQKCPGKLISSRFPSGAPMDRDNQLTGHFFYISLDIFISKALGK